MALLLHLIRKEEMDIFDINVHHITQQYLEYIKTMKKLNLELAGEFIAMAATLIQIKSRMLLPQYNEDGEEIEVEDPRKELVQKLLEYQSFQDVAHRLYERPLVGRDVWVRGTREVITSDKEEEIITEENALFSLIVAYRKAIKSMKKSVHKVSAELQSIADRVKEINSYLYEGAKLRFFDLITKGKSQERGSQMLITFLSLLELAKMGAVNLFQSENFSDIHVEAKKNVSEDALARVEEYDTPNENMGAEEIDLTKEDKEDSEASGQEIMDFADSDDSEEPDLMTDFTGTGDAEAATDEEIFAEEQRLSLDADDADEDVVREHSPEEFQAAAQEIVAEESVNDVSAEVTNESDKSLLDGEV